MAQKFPRGHLAPYIAEYLKSDERSLDYKPFETFIGRELTTMKDLYLLKNNDTVPEPDGIFWEVAKHFLKASKTDPSTVAALTYKYGKSFFKAWFRS